MAIRYYVGDVDDLDGMTREEVIERTYENRSDATEAFDDMLDETSEPFRMGSLEYPASDAWQRVDPIAYDLELSAWVEEVDTDDYEGDDEDEDDARTFIAIGSDGNVVGVFDTYLEALDASEGGYVQE